MIWPFKKKKDVEQSQLYKIVVDQRLTPLELFELITLQYNTPSVRIQPSRVPEALKKYLVLHE